MASIDSLTFDLSDCLLREQSESRRLWLNSSGVAHLLRFESCSPDWSFDLTDPAAAKEFCRRQSVSLGGVMLSAEVTTPAGIEALRGLFKYRDPIHPGSPAMYYVGILWLPFQECCFQINVEAMETGITGTRDVLAVLTEQDARTKPPLDRPEAALRSPSDDERYDELLPDHPLSKVRKRMTEVIGTLEFDASMQSLKLFRIRRGWRFWR